MAYLDVIRPTPLGRPIRFFGVVDEPLGRFGSLGMVSVAVDIDCPFRTALSSDGHTVPINRIVQLWDIQSKSDGHRKSTSYGLGEKNPIQAVDVGCTSDMLQMSQVNVMRGKRKRGRGCYEHPDPTARASWEPSQ
jgi:hypothetical protein